MHLNANLKVKY